MIIDELGPVKVTLVLTETLPALVMETLPGVDAEDPPIINPPGPVIVQTEPEPSTVTLPIDPADLATNPPGPDAVLPPLSANVPVLPLADPMIRFWFSDKTDDEVTVRLPCEALPTVRLYASNVEPFTVILVPAGPSTMLSVAVLLVVATVAALLMVRLPPPCTNSGALLAVSGSNPVDICVAPAWIDKEVSVLIFPNPLRTSVPGPVVVKLLLLP
jgi:hypothetical protein